jgi:heterodisulfide reductase subunit B
MSLEAVAVNLGLEFETIDDWNCCGATEYHTIDKLAAHAVIARNLALVDERMDQVVAPCSACYLNLKKTDRLMTEHPDLDAQVNRALAAGDLSYDAGRLNVRHILDVLYHDVGEQAIRDHVAQPLRGLRVAPYYGCVVVRPYDDLDNSEYPSRLDELLGWLGAEVVDYPVKAHCCGGHMAQISEEQAFELIRRLLSSADEYDADVIACLCPMCQLNLDAYQDRVNSHYHTRFDLPVLFFTQLVGLALGLDRTALGIGKEIVTADPVLDSRIIGTGDTAPEA